MKELDIKSCPRCGQKNPPVRVVAGHPSGIGATKIISCMKCQRVIRIQTAEEEELCASSKPKNS